MVSRDAAVHAKFVVGNVGCYIMALLLPISGPQVSVIECVPNKGMQRSAQASFVGTPDITCAPADARR